MKIGFRLSAALVVIASWCQLIRATTDWTVYLRHAGPVRIGMSLPEVRRILDDPRAHLGGYGGPFDVCAYLQSSAVPENLGIMLSRGRLVRIDVIKAGIRTASGAGVGDTEDKIKRLYPGRITVEPHHYVPDTGHYLIYSPADAGERNYGMIFETEDGKVT
jgi:hypothetical protein